MANEAKFIYGTEVALIATGPSIAAGAMAVYSSSALNSANHNDYPLADLVLNVQFAAAPSDGQIIEIYRQALNIDGTSDEPQPTLSFKYTKVGQFIVAAQASQVLLCPNVPLVKEQQFWLLNNTSQNTTAGALYMDALPKTYGPA